jgi:hypothetical protein
MTPAENLTGRLRGRWHGRYGDLRNRDIQDELPRKARQCARCGNPRTAVHDGCVRHGRRPIVTSDNVTPLHDSRALPRLPPINIEAERALLGALLCNNRWLEAVADFLKPEHFASAMHARILEAIQKLFDRGQIANVVTLNATFDQDPALMENGGARYLAQALANTEAAGVEAEVDAWLAAKGRRVIRRWNSTVEKGAIRRRVPAAGLDAFLGRRRILRL